MGQSSFQVTNYVYNHSVNISKNAKSSRLLTSSSLCGLYGPTCLSLESSLSCVLYSLLFLFVMLQEQSNIWHFQEMCCCHPAVKSFVTRVMMLPSWLKTVPGDGSNPSQHVKLRKLCNKTHKKSNLLDKLLILYSVSSLLPIAKHSAVIYQLLL